MKRWAWLLVFALSFGCMELDDDSSVPDGGPPSGDSSTPPPMDGSLPDADASIDPSAIAWAVRPCTVTLVHRAPGATEVLVAGDFTDWDRAALPMADGDGDGVFEITLDAAETSIVPGQRHAYKFVVDGNWILDSGSSHRKYDGSCLNSAFEVPACTSAPAIVAGPVTTTFDADSATGTASVRLRVLTAGNVAPETIEITLNETAVASDAVRAVAEEGALDVRLSDLPAGKHALHVRVTDAMGRQAEPVDLPIWIEEASFDWRDTTLYMMVVDRFANGDRGADDPAGGSVQYAADWHGGDLEGARAVLESGYFERLGIRAIWLSPLNEQAEGAFEGRDGSNLYTGYHGYWPVSARTVEPRFGGNDALRAFVQEAHRRGIRVLLDLINNQIHEQHEYFASHPDWFRTGCVCGTDPGCGWSERPLDCLFAPYLPDINWRIPEAEQQFIADAIHWVEQYDVDGFRIDAVKHVETNSIFNLRAELMRRFEQGGSRLLLVGETAVGEHDSVDYGCGETYADGYAWIDAYSGDNALDGQFDFPTHHRLQWGLVTGSMGYDEVESILVDSQNRYDPEGLHVRFLGTHDSNRMASRADLDPAQDCRWTGGGSCRSLPSTPTGPETFARLKRAFTVLYTSPGIPFLYYGDEIAMAGGNDPDNRRDMIWTDALTSVAMGDTALSARQTDLRSFVEGLGQARKLSFALRRGRRIPLVAESDLLVYAWSGNGELAVVAVNRGDAVLSRGVLGLTAADVGAVTELTSSLGTGSATLLGTDLSLSLGAGEAAVFLGR